MVIKIINGFIWSSGLFIILISLAGLLDKIKDKVREILNRQSKIRCLCKHKFKTQYEFDRYDYIEFYTKCKKCGKDKYFKIYKKEEQSNGV